MPRPWYAFYADFPDREGLSYLYGGFTPAEGTTPAQVAGVDACHEPKANEVVFSNERGAVFLESERYVSGEAAPPLRKVVIRYDDLPHDVLNGLRFPNAQTRQAAEAWLSGIREKA